MSCQCQRKKIFNYERIRKLAEKMALLEGRVYYVYKKNEREFDFAPFDVACEERLRAVEFVYPV